jgi:hypothetical protein
MRICVLLMLFPLFGSSLVAYGQASKSSEPIRSQASAAYVRQSDGAHVADNKIFEFANPLDDDGNGYIPLLLLKTIHNEHIDGHEETTGFVRVQAWTLAENGTRQKRWNLTTVGNDGESLYEDRFFRVTQWGCCDWPQVNWYFSLLSGKKLYVSNSDLLSAVVLEGGPRLVRYVAFGYYDHGKPPVLQYGSDLKVKQQLSLLSSREYYDAPQVSIRNGGEPAKSLVLEASAGFTIILRYRDGVEIRIPVQNDAVQTDNADLPKGYSLRVENGRHL